MKKRFYLAVALFATIGFAACNSESNENAATDDTSKTHGTSHENMKHAMATIASVYPDTAVTGSAHFSPTGDGKVKMILKLSIPMKANASVAVHIHENAACGDNGKAAGGHWNPTNEEHGKWGSGKFHSGDIGNIALDAQGNGSFEMETDRWSIGGGSNTDILNKSVIVHGGMDDFTSQPAGNSGARIGCGAIKESGAM